MTSKQATKLLNKWQARLCLLDWRIVLIENCSPNDMTLQNCAGESERIEVLKTAVIRIIDEKDYGERILNYDFEQILVHELLHLKFSLLDESGNDIHDRLVHQLIDELARALVAAERSKTK